MRLIITRHGETEENLAGIIQGHLPSKLATSGIAQAKKLALRLKDEKIDFIFSSDLARSADTTKEIIEFHPNIPVAFVKDLRERCFGELEGKKIIDLNLGQKDFTTKMGDMSGGESIEQLYKRVENFLHQILSKHHKDNVLFVGHNGTNKALIAVITGKKHESIQEIENQHNTSISIFEIDEDKNHKIHLLNCIKHLD